MRKGSVDSAGHEYVRPSAPRSVRRMATEDLGHIETSLTRSEILVTGSGEVCLYKCKTAPPYVDNSNCIGLGSPPHTHLVWEDLMKTGARFNNLGPRRPTMKLDGKGVSANFLLFERPFKTDSYSQLEKAMTGIFDYSQLS